jgi:hypothetical protein
MTVAAAVSVPNPRQKIDHKIDMSSLFLQRFRRIRELDSQHRFLQNAFFMVTCTRVFIKDAAFLFRMICSAEKTLILFPTPA